MTTSKKLPTPTTARETISAKARRVGVARSTLEKWARDGTNVHDERQLQERLALRQTRVGTDPPSPENPARESYGEARRRREIAAANRMETIAAKERGELVEIHSIAADGERIGFAVRSTFDQLAHELAPRLAGQDAARVHKILKAVFRDALNNLSHYKSDVKFTP